MYSMKAFKGPLTQNLPLNDFVQLLIESPTENVLDNKSEKSIRK